LFAKNIDLFDPEWRNSEAGCAFPRPSSPSAPASFGPRFAPTRAPARIEKMTASAPLDQAWNYPLFEALYHRRSRRFGLGFEMQEGPFRYKSAHAPVPLTELEEALLVGAGAGFTGLAFWDLPTPAPYPRLSGRTFPTTRDRAVLDQRRRVLCPRRQGRGQQAARGRNQGGT
jgi:hypothetical protein